MQAGNEIQGAPAKAGPMPLRAGAFGAPGSWDVIPTVWRKCRRAPRTGPAARLGCRFLTTRGIPSWALRSEALLQRHTLKPGDFGLVPTRAPAVGREAPSAQRARCEQPTD